MVEPMAHIETGHIDLILEQIDQLPTLSPIAVRIINVVESGGADLREIAKIIELDPALTAKLLSLCQRADRTTSTKITTIDRAVVMLGLEAVRAAVLSVEIFGLLTSQDDQPVGVDPFDRKELWRHMVAVASASELLVEARPDLASGYTPQEAFLAGLLQGIGKIALDRILPKAFAKVVTICERQQVNIAEVERRVLGIDHHIAGKRLAEHWGLPHALQDVIWLSGQTADSLPDLPHRGLIGMVTVAQALVRAMHIGWSGEVGEQRDFANVCEDFGCAPQMVLELGRDLEHRVAARAAILNIDQDVEGDVLMRALARANERLGRMAHLLEARGRLAAGQSQALSAIRMFHMQQSDRRSMTGVLSGVVRAAVREFGAGFCVVLTQTRSGAPWSVLEIGDDGHPQSRWLVSRPEGAGDLSELLDTEGMGIDAAPVLSWLEEEFGSHARDGVALKVLPLERGCGGGVTAALVHDLGRLSDVLGEEGVSALSSVWGGSIVAAAQHEGAKRLGERVVEINRELTEAQAKLVESESMARLGQLAAGAAHEMNNPLTVISGNAQMLASSLRSPDQKAATDAIVGGCKQLTELITSLHILADPSEPVRVETDILGLLKTATKQAQDQSRLSHGVRVIREGAAPYCCLDAGQIGQAVTELVLNALQSGPRRNVEVRAQIDPLDDRLLISVVDDGVGMSDQAKRHACDPFFSELSAGRRSGLGLTRARRFIELHGGTLSFESKPQMGTTARIVLPAWHDEQTEESSREAA